jgi:hypothetical protein
VEARSLESLPSPSTLQFKDLQRINIEVNCSRRKREVTWSRLRVNQLVLQFSSDFIGCLHYKLIIMVIAVVNMIVDTMYYKPALKYYRITAWLVQSITHEDEPWPPILRSATGLGLGSQPLKSSCHLCLWPSRWWDYRCCPSTDKLWTTSIIDDCNGEPLWPITRSFSTCFDVSPVLW